ncbi:EbsC Uncharacterized conserved protein [Rhabdaerophilaceae bacterium]
MTTDESDPNQFASEPAQELHTPAVKRALTLLLREGIPYNLRKLAADDLSHEAKAAACNTDLTAITRVLLYKGKTSKKPVILMSSAASAVNERTLAELVGEVLEKADAAFAERIAGFALNAMPPSGHLQRIPILMDESLIRLGRIWFQAGEIDIMMTAPTYSLARALAARIIKVN